MKSFETLRIAGTGWIAAVAVVTMMIFGSIPVVQAQEAAPAQTPAADATAAPAPAAPVGLQPTTAVVENPYTLRHMLEVGGPVTWGTFSFLVLMSVSSWYIFFVRLWDQSVLLRQGRSAHRTLRSAGTLRDGIAKVDPGSVFGTIVDDGQTALALHQKEVSAAMELNEWMTVSLQLSVDAINSRMQMGLAVLATVGSTAPFVGLFGTVWGILNALLEIGLSGQMSIERVAGPLGEALQMTAFGLFVAVPAVIAYNLLLRRNKAVLEQVRAFTVNVHAVLLNGAKAAA